MEGKPTVPSGGTDGPSRLLPTKGSAEIRSRIIPELHVNLIMFMEGITKAKAQALAYSEGQSGLLNRLSGLDESPV